MRHGPYSLTACWAEAFTSERHTAGCGLHRVIASGFRGIQKCISTIINKSALAGRQQLLHPYGHESRQLNSLINAAPIVCCALGGCEILIVERIVFSFFSLFLFIQLFLRFNGSVWARFHRTRTSGCIHYCVLQWSGFLDPNLNNSFTTYSRTSAGVTFFFISNLVSAALSPSGGFVFV